MNGESDLSADSGSEDALEVVHPTPSRDDLQRKTGWSWDDWQNRLLVVSAGLVVSVIAVIVGNVIGVFTDPARIHGARVFYFAEGDRVLQAVLLIAAMVTLAHVRAVWGTTRSWDRAARLVAVVGAAGALSVTTIGILGALSYIENATGGTYGRPDGIAIGVATCLLGAVGFWMATWVIRQTSERLRTN